MQITLPSEIIGKMRRHMIFAGRREIGGMIMGEEIGDQKFRIVDFSVDIRSGTRSSFIRDADEHEEALSKFFERTGANYCRFNYLGEWHTHPSFSVQPSANDIRAMQDLVDGTGGVNFAVLFIARLRWFWNFDCSAHLFVQGHKPRIASVVQE